MDTGTDSDNDDVEYEHELRQARNRTSFSRRITRSLYPLEFMDMELSQNDNGALNISGFNDYLTDLFEGILIGGLLPAVYCGGITFLSFRQGPR